MTWFEPMSVNSFRYDVTPQESHPFTRKCTAYHNAWMILQQIHKSNTSEGTDIVLAVGWEPPPPQSPLPLDTPRLFSRGFCRNMQQPRGALGKLLCVSFPFATAVGIFDYKKLYQGFAKHCNARNQILVDF